MDHKPGISGVTPPRLSATRSATDGRPMKTLRYVVCGALTGYGIVVHGLMRLPVGAVDDVTFTALLAVCVFGGGLFGYRHTKNKHVRTDGVVRDLPERTHDGSDAMAA